MQLGSSRDQTEAHDSQLDLSLPWQDLARGRSKFHGYIPEFKSRQELGLSPEPSGTPEPTHRRCAGEVSPTAEVQRSQIKMLMLLPCWMQNFSSSLLENMKLPEIVLSQ